MKRAWIFLGVAFALIGANEGTSASAINVLWYSYADPLSEYRSTIGTIAADAGGYIHGAGLDWNLTFYGPGDPEPNFSAYDVLVIESGEAFRTGPPGGPLATPDYSGILGDEAAIEAARGSRTFISGSDADFHAVRGDTGNGGSPAPGSEAAWDGALGYVVNAVDWAASGVDLGILSFYDGDFPGSKWWLDPSSFLRDELTGNFQRATDNTPYLSPELAALSVNDGLTTQGLSNWNNSFHGRFLLDTPGYDPTVLNDPDPTFALSIFRDTAAVPEPDILALLGIGLAGLGFSRRKRWRIQREEQTFPSKETMNDRVMDHACSRGSHCLATFRSHGSCKAGRSKVSSHSAHA